MLGTEVKDDRSTAEAVPCKKVGVKVKKKGPYEMKMKDDRSAVEAVSCKKVGVKEVELRRKVLTK